LSVFTSFGMDHTCYNIKYMYHDALTPAAPSTLSSIAIDQIVQGQTSLLNHISDVIILKLETNVPLTPTIASWPI